MTNSSKIKRGILIIVLLMLVCNLPGYAEMQTDTFSFFFEGKRYSGLVDMPRGQRPGSMVILIPGSGQTNIVAGKWFSNLRDHFTELGLACLVWDKAGCGKSEGVFDYNQTIQNSASEAIAAITEAKARNMPGSERIGLWGISRGGWICPLVIGQHPVAFWISVSGTDDKENFGYLLEKNFIIEGRSKRQARKLKNEWLRGIEIARTGGTFEENLKATENLRNDSFYKYINGSSEPTKEGYLQWQKKFETGENVVDEATGLVIYVPGFADVLAKINCPVLAISGEKDSQVDWRKTMSLYKNTIGRDPNASLTIKVLPDCNHNMQQCKTGGFREKLTTKQPCTGYYEIMTAWLKEKGFGK